MGKVYDVVAVVGKYTDKTGKEKSRYANLGAVIETKNGLMLKLETVPVNWEGFAYLNEPKPREDAPQTRPQADETPPFDDRVPF